MNRKENIQYIVSFLKEKTGIVLSQDKFYLFQTRLLPVFSKYGFKDLDSFFAVIRFHKDPEMISDFIDAMTTNETFFFRDKRPFEQFRDIIFPTLEKRLLEKKKIRIWSSACSSGQEPYSLAMMISDIGLQEKGFEVDLVASDISQSVLRKAKEGSYTAFEMQRGLPSDYLDKFFVKKNNCWVIKDHLKKMVDFRQINLLDIPSNLGIFDVIYCRNVLIYFDLAMKKKILSRLANMLLTYGVLVLGGAETVLGISNDFKEVVGQRGMFERV